MSNEPDFPEKGEALKRIPQVSQILEQLSREWKGADSPPHSLAADSARMVLDKYRQRILAADSPEELGRIESKDLELIKLTESEINSRLTSNLKRLINATGVILHTNLGRAPLPESARSQVLEAAGGYLNLEIDLESGKRFSRLEHVEHLLCELTGAEAATVVNNNAGATLLVLATFAKNREVIISRGQLIEIGGSFRLPEIMAESGARLLEVGTTNRTYLEDYRKAIGPETAMIMRVHQSNYQIIGYVHDVVLSDLVDLAHERFLPMVDDLGSGALVSLSDAGIPDEPLVQDSITAGADVVTFSGDKLLGGPQAGIILGKKEFIDGLRKNPLSRALRVGKMTLVALEAVLRIYRDPERARQEIPNLKMIFEPASSVQERALGAKFELEATASTGLSCEVVKDISRIGGGSLPTAEVETYALSLSHPDISAEKLAERLRASNPPVIGRVKGDLVILDLRTVSDDEIPLLIDILTSLGD